MQELSIGLISVGMAGVLLTIFLVVTSKKTKKIQVINIADTRIHVFKLGISLILFMYLFRLFMFCFTGLLSGVYLLVIIGGIIAFLPILFLYCLSAKKSTS
jgi:hypothetical protein